MGCYVKNRDLELLITAQEVIHLEFCCFCVHNAVGAGCGGYAPLDCTHFRNEPGRIGCLSWSDWRSE